ncbi:MAG: pilus assembly protein TadG-related protein [Pseudomonadota bacterium]
MVGKPVTGSRGRWATNMKARIAAFASDQDGATYMFALVIFILMLIFGGLAVDVARLESQRVKLQQTADRAVLAAADLDNFADPEAVVQDYFDKAGLSQFLDSVTVETTLNGKTISANTSSEVQTMLLHLVGVDSLTAVGVGAAQEQVTDIEISLVVDVSGSMGGNKLTNLKDAAEDFFKNVMVQDNSSGALTTVSVIPYNAHVNIGWDLAGELNIDTRHAYSNCTRFRDDSVRDDFATTAIGPTTYIERTGHFEYYQTTRDFLDVQDQDFWCEPNDNRYVMVHQTDPQVLIDHVDLFWASGWTAIDQGMKWGAALLDPAFNPILEDMADNGDVPVTARGRPAAFEDQETMKIIVLMTDGANTVQRDFPAWAKDAMSPVWYSQAAANETGNWYDGYYVDLNYEATPSNKLVPNWRDWYRPRHPTTTKYSNGSLDDQWMGWHNRPDAVRLSYYDLLERFTNRDMQRFFWRYAHYDSRYWNNKDDRPKVWDWNRHKDMGPVHTNAGTADTQVKDFCDMIKNDPTKRVQIFAIAFQAPQAGEEVMQHCASSSGNYYDVNGLDIDTAFESIASQINYLRLIQ